MLFLDVVDLISISLILDHCREALKTVEGLIFDLGWVQLAGVTKDVAVTANYCDGQVIQIKFALHFVFLRITLVRNSAIMGLPRNLSLCGNLQVKNYESVAQAIFRVRILLGNLTVILALDSHLLGNRLLSRVCRVKAALEADCDASANTCIRRGTIHES